MEKYVWVYFFNKYGWCVKYKFLFEWLKVDFGVVVRVRLLYN